jgi:hypothetical protein
MNRWSRCSSTLITLLFFCFVRFFLRFFGGGRCCFIGSYGGIDTIFFCLFVCKVNILYCKFFCQIKIRSIYYTCKKRSKRKYMIEKQNNRDTFSLYFQYGFFSFFFVLQYYCFLPSSSSVNSSECRMMMSTWNECIG